MGGAGCSGGDDDVSFFLLAAALLCGDDRRLGDVRRRSDGSAALGDVVDWLGGDLMDRRRSATLWIGSAALGDDLMDRRRSATIASATMGDDDSGDEGRR